MSNYIKGKNTNTQNWNENKQTNKKNTKQTLKPGTTRKVKTWNLKQ